MKKPRTVTIKELDAAKIKYRKDRDALLTQFGGRCSWCGFSDYRALNFDHVNGGGNKQREVNQSWIVRHRLIRAHPDEYQILCANCNAIKRIINQEHRRSTIREAASERHDEVPQCSVANLKPGSETADIIISVPTETQAPMT